jgi:hypothetical protein
MAKRLTADEKIQKEAETYAMAKGFDKGSVYWYWHVEAYKAGAKRQSKWATK